MAIPTVALDEDNPDGTDLRSEGDDRIREYKKQNREVLEVDHVYPSSGTDDDAGKHKQVSLVEAADIGSGAEGLPIAGAQTVDDQPEFTYTDEDDNDVVLTDKGKIALQNGRLPNDTYLIARNEGDDGDVDLIKAGRNEADDDDVPLIPDESRLASDAAPTEDTQIVNKKYVDDSLDINAKDEKTTPVGADLLLIEDSEDSNVKKKVQIENLSGIMRAWVHCDSAGNILASYNVSSVVRNSTGDYTVNWDTNFASANYAVVATAVNWHMDCVSRTAEAARFNEGNSDHSLVDGAFSVIAIGAQ